MGFRVRIGVIRGRARVRVRVGPIDTSLVVKPHLPR